jgi:hypothetical protein
MPRNRDASARGHFAIDTLWRICDLRHMQTYKITIGMEHPVTGQIQCVSRLSIEAQDASAAAKEAEYYRALMVARCPNDRWVCSVQP